MQLTQLYLKNFRCFADKTITFESPLVLIEGNNGSGKTSLLEALHYLCYLRSFRTHSPRDLLFFGHETFFIKALCEQSGTVAQNHEIQVGFSHKKRLVKIDQRAVSSYKELMDYYRIVTLTEDDVVLIQGGPDVRRVFLDQAIILHDSSHAVQLRDVRTVVENRTALLQRGSLDQALYKVVTEQLWSMTNIIAHTRKEALKALEHESNNLLQTFFDPDMVVAYEYNPKSLQADESFAEFWQRNQGLCAQEIRYGRTLFGAHLDDFSIHFAHKKSKNFASRGQQKLVVLLIKIAQMKILLEKKGPAIFLLDDFMTDFDDIRLARALDALMALKSQLIFTVPTRFQVLEQGLGSHGAQKIKLTH